MKTVYLLAVCLVFQTTAFPQKIDIAVRGLESADAQLSALAGEKILPIDSFHTSARGRFILLIDHQQRHTGIYRLSFDKNRWIDFIYDGEDASISTDANNISDSITVIQSESNRLYYRFLKLHKQFKIKSELLHIVTARYPKDDDFYTVTQNKLSQLQKEYLEFVKGTSQKDPNSFIAKYVRSSQLPVVDGNLPPERQLTYLKFHALDKVDFSDDALIYSDVFSSKTIEYLTYYRNPQLPKELLEKGFMVAVDTLLGKAKVNTFVYKQVVEYLLDGFKKFGFDAIINYIIENYVIKDDICIDKTLEIVLQRRLDQAKYLKIGKTVPNIISADLSEKQVELNKIQSAQTLLIFYAAWCPHCQMLLPQINELYKNQKEKKIEVIAVSIDTSKTAWQDYISSNGLTWINVSDLQGWNSVVVREYFIYATPTIFLLNSKKEIVAKPSSLGELRAIFHE